MAAPYSGKDNGTRTVSDPVPRQVGRAPERSGLWGRFSDSAAPSKFKMPFLAGKFSLW